MTQATDAHDHSSDDEVELRSVPDQLLAACNRGDADGFAALFSETADFFEFEGTHLKGRDEIAAFHRPLFETLLKGWRFEGRVDVVRRLDADRAVIRASTTTTLPGDERPAPAHDSMQLYVLTRKRSGSRSSRPSQWVIDVMQNARTLSLARQTLLDELDGFALDSTPGG
jgi:uncharacterized protein (TIGR02246 family)